MKNGSIDPSIQDPVAIALGFGRRYDIATYSLQPELTLCSGNAQGNILQPTRFL